MCGKKLRLIRSKDHVPTDKRRIYAYLDESGQNTLTRLHLVAPVVVWTDPEPERERLRLIEDATNPLRRKWHKASQKNRDAYLRRVFSSRDLESTFYFAEFVDQVNFFELGADAIAAAARHKRALQVRVDYEALPRKQRPVVTKRIRSHGFSIAQKHVKGTPCRECEFLRLSDMLCGFLRDWLEGQDRARDFYREQGVAERMIRLSAVPPSG